MSLQALVAVLTTWMLHGAMGLEDMSNYTFEQYRKDFGRTYRAGDGEYEMRQSLFNERITQFQAHNAQKLSWTMGINDLTDRTQEELKMLRGHRPWMRSLAVGNTMRSHSLLNISGDESGNGNGTACTAHQQLCTNTQAPCCSDLVCGSRGQCEKVKQMPRAYDWSDILPTARHILNQGSCGSCWAVAATGALQLQAVINSGGRFKKQLSAQNFVSCTPNPLECGGQGGCKGATAELAYQWLVDAGARGGIHTQDQQSYTATETKSSCPACATDGFTPSFLQRKEYPKEDVFGPAISITGFKRLPENNAAEMMKHLVTVGPLVGAVVGDGLYSYEGGVISGCKSTVMDHAVLMMGYGEEPTQNMMYWNVRNSWGNNWGEKGYFRVQRFYPDKKEPCAMDYDTDKGVACKDKPGPEGKYPASQEVCGACAILGDTVYPVGTHVPPALYDDEPDVKNAPHHRLKRIMHHMWDRGRQVIGIL